MKENIINFQQYKNKKSGIIEEKGENIERSAERIENINEEEKITENTIKCLENECEIEDMDYGELYDIYCEILHLNKNVCDTVVGKCEKEYITKEDKTLKQLLWEVDIEEILNILEEMFDYEDYEIDAYRSMCKDLLVKETNEEKAMNLVINSDGDFIAIKDGKIVRDLELKSWEEWLSSKCSEEIMKKITKEEWVARCLWTMTFVSFDEESIMEKNEMIEELKGSIIESKGKDRYTLKELMWKVNWLDVKEVINDFYIYAMDLEEIKQLEEEYEAFYKRILSKEPKTTDENERIICKMSGEVYIYNTETQEVKEICEEYWEKILSIKCSEVSYKTINFEEMVAHTIAEMMFFTSNEQEHIEIMKKREESLKE